MMIKLRLAIVLISFTTFVQAQGIVVNSDGTHSVVINNGSTSTIVNPNGTHSTAITNGNTSIIVNPNGTHSTAFHNGNTSIIVNPNGTHSTAFHNGNTSTIVNPDGTHSVGVNVGGSLLTPPNDALNKTNEEEKNQGNKSRFGTWNDDEDYWFSEPKVKERKIKKRSKAKKE